MIRRMGRARRGAALAGGGFVAVVALVLGIAVAMSSAAAPSPTEGPALLASAPALAGTKLPDPQTRARNAWALALVSANRWRTAVSAFAGTGDTELAVAAPCRAAGHAVPPGRPAAAATPRALPSRTYASQAPPLFVV